MANDHDVSEVNSSGASEVNSVRKGLGVLTALVGLLLILLLVAVIVFGARSVDDEAVSSDETALVNKSLYQSVFLTNGQVYFGKLTTVNEDFYRLTDIFYLQVQQQVQPTGTDSAAPPTTLAPSATSQGQTQLVKLGEELHGPEDSMQINRSQVQFWENLKADGSVAKAIASYVPE